MLQVIHIMMYNFVVHYWINITTFVHYRILSIHNRVEMRSQKVQPEAVEVRFHRRKMGRPAGMQLGPVVSSISPP